MHLPLAAQKQKKMARAHAVQIKFATWLKEPVLRRKAFQLEKHVKNLAFAKTHA